jgi:signal transduction histidine kinase
MNGYLELWRTGQYQKFPPEKQEDIKKKIITANDQLSSIIHSMIGALEVEGGMSDIRPEIFNLGDLIKEIYETDFAGECAKKGLACSIDVSAAPNILSDRRYISEVIMNLLDNAIKYTSVGNINLRTYSEGPNAVITLTDTGIGLSEDDMEGLFQKFIRGEMASKLSPGGSGIGLYVAKQILSALNGDIQAISKGRNQGTTFIIKIPIKK